MKIYFILLISIILITSCKDCPVEYVEVPKDTLKSINFKHNLQESNFMYDTDTLKIEILDTNIIDSKSLNNDLFSVKASISSSVSGTPNHVFELISSDLRFEVNPYNNYEMWIMNFQPNIDSTRTFSVGRYIYYTLAIDFSSINPYYLDSYFTIFVESTTE